MKFIHIADIHGNRERKDETVKVIEEIIDYCKNNKVDTVLFCGDFWDSIITNTLASGFSELVQKMHELIKEVKVIMIYGTPSHEPDGSLDVFKELGADVFSEISFKEYNDYSIIAIPEPRLGLLKGSSLEEKAKTFHKSLKSIKNISDKPLIIMYHGDVEGAVLQNNMTIPKNDFALSKEELKSFNADYIACGHIHKPQMIMDNCYYSGSACPKDFGETHDAIFKVVEI